jgi:hypothetical protein
MAIFSFYEQKKPDIVTTSDYQREFDFWQGGWRGIHPEIQQKAVLWEIHTTLLGFSQQEYYFVSLASISSIFRPTASLPPKTVPSVLALARSCTLA